MPESKCADASDPRDGVGRPARSRGTARRRWRRLAGPEGYVL